MEILNPIYNYDKSGQLYTNYRKTDPRIEKIIHQHLGDAKTVLNVGAGTGSYEPTDRYVTAIEPSAVMRAQRPSHRVPAINAKADNIPFDDNSFDAAMAMITIHHWPDLSKGLKELARVAKKRVLILTCDPDALDLFWNKHYFPELVEVESKRFPTVERIVKDLNGECEVMKVPVPLDCIDGFQEAFYGRPEFFLKKEVRACQSSWGCLPAGMEDVLVKRLETELLSGEWDKKFGHLRTQPFFEGSLTLIVAKYKKEVRGTK